MKLSHGLGIEASMALLLFQLQQGHLDPNTLQHTHRFTVKKVENAYR